MQKPFIVLCGGGVEEGKEKAGEFDFGVRRIFRRSMLKLVELRSQDAILFQKGIEHRGFVTVSKLTY
jgi:hypothetical protein